MPSTASKILLSCVFHVKTYVRKFDSPFMYLDPLILPLIVRCTTTSSSARSAILFIGEEVFAIYESGSDRFNFAILYVQLACPFSQ